jgi:alpha-ribazole phosphatase
LVDSPRAGRPWRRFWHALAHEAAPGGESLLAVIERVSRAVHRVVETYAGRDVIAVAHGYTIRTALALVLGLGPEAVLAFKIENGWHLVTVIARRGGL